MHKTIMQDIPYIEVLRKHLNLGELQEAYILWESLVLDHAASLTRSILHITSDLLILSIQLENGLQSNQHSKLINILMQENWDSSGDSLPVILHKIYLLKKHDFTLLLKVIERLQDSEIESRIFNRDCRLLELAVWLSLPIRFPKSIDREVYLKKTLSDVSNISVLRLVLYGDEVFINRVDKNRRERIKTVLENIIPELHKQGKHEHLFNISNLIFIDPSFQDLDKSIQALFPEVSSIDLMTAEGGLSQRKQLRMHKTDYQVNYFQKSLKIAVCVSGQMRGYQEVLPTWQCFVSDRHQIDYFIHTWRNLGRKYPFPRVANRTFTKCILQAYQRAWSLIGEDGLNEMYPTFMNIAKGLEDARFSINSVSESKLKELYKTDKVVVEDPNSSSLQGFSHSLEFMFYKISQCYQLIQEEYDLVVRIRPDKIISACNLDKFDWCDVYNSTRDRTILLDRPLYGHMRGLPDMFAIGDMNTMSVYADTFNIRNTILSKNYYHPYPDLNCPHSTLRHNLHVNGIKVQQIGNIQFGLFQDSPKICPDQLLQVLEFDISQRASFETDKILLEACREDKIS